MTTVEVLGLDGRPWPGPGALEAPLPGTSSTIAVVLVADGEEVGRGWARLDAGAGADALTATTWAPRLRADLAAGARDAALDAFARWVVHVGDRVGAATVETKPADDVAALDAWLAALTRSGFTEVAVAHLMSRDLPLGHGRRPPAGGHVLVELGQLGPERRLAVEALIGAVHRSSADRVDATDRRSGPQVLAGLAGNRVAAPAPQLWLTALAGGAVVGFVLGSVDDDGAVWVMDIGVEPRARRKGIGRSMLASMLDRARPAPRALALVDDVNLASRRLHRAVGFVEEPGAYRTWRRATAYSGRASGRRGGSVNGVPPVP